jgi:WD40 repeat protein
LARSPAACSSQAAVIARSTYGRLASKHRFWYVPCVTDTVLFVCFKLESYCVSECVLLCAQSLSGHTSSVEAVQFDSAEVLVLAGSSNGSIKLWDLEEAKGVFDASIRPQ